MIASVVRFEHSETEFFQVLGPQEILQLDRPNPQEFLPAVVRASGQWVYLVGTRPKITVDEEVILGATGSTMVVHVVPASGSLPLRVRGVLLSMKTAGNGYVTTHGETRNMAENEFVDAKFDANGGFLGFDGPTEFKQQTAPETWALMPTIEAARIARGLPS